MKVLGLVSSCRECPNRVYYSGGRYECSKAGATLPYDSPAPTPEWCPLAEYPAAAMNRLQQQNTAAPDMLAALKAVNELISEAAGTGFNCHVGDWAERLFESQQATSRAIRIAEART